MESNPKSQVLQNLFPGDIPKGFQKFESIVAGTQKNESPVTVEAGGYEFRLYYESPTKDTPQEITVVGIQDAPELDIRKFGKYYKGKGIGVKLMRFDGRSKTEEIQF